jgi:uncharacterized membrane protein YraQ (UPF0718 family)
MEEFFNRFLGSFWNYTIEVWPYFFLALLMVSFLKVYLNASFFIRILRLKKSAPLLTGTLAALLPVCSCSVIPLAYFIHNFSFNFAPVLAFLMIGPVVSPVTILLTIGLLGPKFALFRLIFSFVISLGLAYLTILLFKKEERVLEYPEQKVYLKEKKLKRVWKEFKEEGFEIGKYLLLGLLIASILVTLLTPEKLTFLSRSSFSYLLIAFISIPIYVCSGEEVPLARALLDLGFSPGQAMIFVLAGSGICVPTLIASLRFLPLKVVLYYLFSWFILSIGAGLLYDLIN